MTRNRMVFDLVLELSIPDNNLECGICSSSSSLQVFSWLLHFIHGSLAEDHQSYLYQRQQHQRMEAKVLTKLSHTLTFPLTMDLSEGNLTLYVQHRLVSLLSCFGYEPSKV